MIAQHLLDAFYYVFGIWYNFRFEVIYSCMTIAQLLLLLICSQPSYCDVCAIKVLQRMNIVINFLSGNGISRWSANSHTNIWFAHEFSLIWKKAKRKKIDRFDSMRVPMSQTIWNAMDMSAFCIHNQFDFTEIVNTNCLSVVHLSIDSCQPEFVCACVWDLYALCTSHLLFMFKSCYNAVYFFITTLQLCSIFWKRRESEREKPYFPYHRRTNEINMSNCLCLDLRIHLLWLAN